MSHGVQFFERCTTNGKYCASFPDVEAAIAGLELVFPREHHSDWDEGPWKVQALEDLPSILPSAKQSTSYFEVSPRVDWVPKCRITCLIGVGIAFEHADSSPAHTILRWELQGCKKALEDARRLKPFALLESRKRHGSYMYSMDTWLWPDSTFGCGIASGEDTIFFTKNGGSLHDHLIPTELQTWSRFRPVVYLAFRTRSDAHIDGCPFTSTELNFTQSRKPNNSGCLYDVCLHEPIRTRALVRARALPEEILAMVIGHLMADIGYLVDIVPRPGQTDFDIGTCALVCQHWSTFFRPVLFHTAHVGSPRRLRALLGLTQRYPRVLPHMLHLVRKLYLKSADGTTLPPALEALLSTHTHHLGALELLSAAATLPAPPRVELALPALLRPLRSATSVVVRNRTFVSVAQLLTVLHSLPLLRSFHLQNVAFRHRGPVRAGHRAAVSARLQEWTLDFRVGVHAADPCVVQLCSLLLLGDADGEDTDALARLVMVLLSPEADADGGEGMLPSEARSGDYHWDRRPQRMPPGQNAATLTHYPPSSAPRALLTVRVHREEQLRPRSPFRAARFSLVLHDAFVPAPLPETRAFAAMLGALDAQHAPGYRFCVRVQGTHQPRVPDVRNSLLELMPRAHGAGLVSVVEEGAA